MNPTTPRGPSLEHLPRLLLWSVLGMVLTGAVALGVWSLLAQAPLHPWFSTSSARLPIYASVPDFALTDQSGRPVRNTDLLGKICIVGFVFTTCVAECPLITAQMAQLQSELVHLPDLRLISISVDPERDTPALLSQYAARSQADPERWLFLTGDKRAVYRLIREGFRVGVVDPAESSQPTPIRGSALGTAQGVWGWRPVTWLWQSLSWSQLYHRGWRFMEVPAAFADHGRAQDLLHSTRLVLIDRRGHIRGYYDSREEEALQRLRQHLQMLLREA